jgi:MFS family permease
VERDLRTILKVQGMRAFLYGAGSVLIGTSLATAGYSSARAGVVFTSMLAGMALTSLVVGRFGDRIGRRRAYMLLLGSMGVAGAVFGLTRSLPWLIVAALTGTMSTDANESGPITSLEQAMIGVAPAAERTRVFGRYNAVAYLGGSFGALAAGPPAALRRVLPHLSSQRALLVFPVVAVLCVVVARGLSDAVEHHGASTGRALDRSRPAVLRLAGLFAVDAFAGGFVVQSFLAFWFARRYGASLETMSLVFFSTGLLQAASSIVAGRVARRIGLLNTMVWTHLPSNVFLALIPLSPTLGGAIALLLARVSLSQMDVPARQAYVVALVDPSERVAAAATTNTARYLSRPFGPTVATGLMQVALGAPFVAAGALKGMYDVALYFVFRRVTLPE